MTPEALLPARSVRTARISRKAPLLFVSILVADGLFVGHPIGLSAALFLLLLLATHVLENRDNLEPAALKAALILPAITIPALVENTSWISLGFAVLAILTVVLSKEVVWYRNPRRWLRLAGRFLPLGFVATVRDAVRFCRALRGSTGMVAPQSLVSWLLPLGTSLVFGLLFAYANPVIGTWLGWLVAMEPTSLPDRSRALFWLACIPILWPLLRGSVPGLIQSSRARAGVLQTESATDPEAVPGTDPAADRAMALRTAIVSPVAVLRSLVLFNILFAVQMLLDAVYLLGGATLPDGMSYAHYAHRGAYPLVAAALLAGVFVIVAVRPGTPMEKDPLTRRLVFAWIGQTLVLLATSLWRLDLYVSAYSLTYLRAAAAIWMILVGFGLGWILVRLFANKSNAWLIKANLLTLLAVLHACCFVDFGGQIARFNVETRLADATGYGRARHTIDLLYLSKIGPAAIPALDRFANAPEAPVRLRNDAARYSRLLRMTFRDTYRGWRSFTFRRFRLSRYIARHALPIPSLSSMKKGATVGPADGKAVSEKQRPGTPSSGGRAYGLRGNEWTLE